MTLVQIDPPEALPVSLDDAKAHLRVTVADEDDLISGLIRMATARLDGRDGLLGRALAPQTWQLVRHGFPGKAAPIMLPLPPLMSVDTVAYFDPDGAGQMLDAVDYRVIGGGGGPSTLLPAQNKTWPATLDELESVTITFTAGYDDGASPPGVSLPEPLKAALMFDIAHLYQHREAVMMGADAGEVPLGYRDLIQPFRIWEF